jgi:hypothetical protein
MKERESLPLLKHVSLRSRSLCATVEQVSREQQEGQSCMNRWLHAPEGT